MLRQPRSVPIILVVALLALTLPAQNAVPAREEPALPVQPGHPPLQGAGQGLDQLVHPMSPEELTGLHVVEPPALQVPQPGDLPVPGAPRGIGPGNAIAITGVGGCTAAWVFTDAAGAFYLGSAGHCFLSDQANSEEPGWTSPEVRICVVGCEGGFLDLDGSTWLALGEVVYAQQQEDGRQVGKDFGLVRIPESLERHIRPELWFWGGPTGALSQDRPAASPIPEIALQYGQSVGFGESFLTEGRGGLFSGVSADGATVSYLGPAGPGDSGSPVAIATATELAERPQAREAAGVVTHIHCCPVHFPGPPATITSGTHIQEALRIIEEKTELAGVRLVTAGE